MQSVKPADDQTLFRLLAPIFWNIIDADGALSATTKISVPKAVKDVSLGHIHKRKLEKTEVPKKESNYLLLSQAGAITTFHQDFSGASVIYFIVKGETKFGAQFF